MKIVFDARIHLNYYSGISRYIICLLESYAQLFPEDNITVLLNPTIQSDNSIYQVLQKFKNISFQIINTSHMGPKNYLVMGRIIKKLNPDVYHYPHLDAPIFTGRVPVVATIHDTNSNKNIKKYDDRFGLKSAYFNTSLKLTLKKASKIIFVSDTIKNEVLERFHLNKTSDKFVRIYNGIESNFGKIEEEKFKELETNFLLPKNYFLYVGQIREHKNVFRIIEAYKKFRLTNKTQQLVLIGHNYLDKELSDESIIHLDKVSNSELKFAYANCTALLFPSLFEGFGFPILEAFSFGKPVITSNYGAMAEVAGEQGVLVNPTSVDEISSAMQIVLKDDGKSLNRKNHCLNFTWENNARELREVYLNVCKNKTS